MHNNIQSRIEMAKKAFIEERILFTGKMNLEQKKRIIKCLVWSVALYAADDVDIHSDRQKMLHDLANVDGCVTLKWVAEDREVWRHRERMSNTCCTGRSKNSHLENFANFSSTV